MATNGTALMLWGGMLLAAYAAHVVGVHTRVPRVTLLLLLGVLCGPSGFELLPNEATAWFPLIAQLALAMVGFLLGEEFVGNANQHSRKVLGFATVVTLLTATAVTLGVLAVGGSVPLALILGGIATATDPAATLDLVRETRARGPLTDLVKGTVASDDVLGVMVFSFTLAAAEMWQGVGSPTQELARAAWEIIGAVVLGLVAGIPMAWMTGRLRPGEPAALEALGFVLLVAGVASHWEVSFLMASMTLGGTVAWRAKHYTRAVHEIEGFSTPLLAMFFFLAGFQLELESLLSLGVTGLTYVLARIAGRLGGSRLVGQIGISRPLSRRAGWCLLPQAGVAIGLGLIAAERLPEIGNVVLPIAIGATVLFEVVGPIAARIALSRAGELHPEEAEG